MHAITRRLGAGAALALTLAALAGSAFAAPPSSPPGQEQTPPGQEQKADNAATPAPAQGKATAPGQEKKAEKATTKTTTKSTEKSTTKSTESKSTGQRVDTSDAPVTPWTTNQGKALNNVPDAAAAIPSNATGAGPGNSGWHKYTICHNGHLITVDVHSASAHVGAHMEAGSDLFPAGLTFGAKGDALCSSEQAATTTTAPVVTVSCPTTTTTLVTGVRHETGSASNPVVVIHPSSSSAHFSKHGEEAETITLTTATGQSCAASVPTGSFAAAVTEAKSAVSQALGSPVVSATPATSAASAASAPAGGVLGVEAQGEGRGGAGGVAGAFGVLGEVAGVLPFTGLSLWAIVLVALAAVAIGYALWRRSHAPTARDVV